MFTVILVIVYLVGIRVVGRRYFARRHGLLWRSGDIGGMRAALVGMAWPLTVWLPTVRQPELCSHHNHVLQRNRLRAEIEMVEQLRRDERP